MSAAQRRAAARRIKQRYPSPKAVKQQVGYQPKKGMKR